MSIYGTCGFAVSADGYKVWSELTARNARWLAKKNKDIADGCYKKLMGREGQKEKDARDSASL